MVTSVIIRVGYKAITGEKFAIEAICIYAYKQKQGLSPKERCKDFLLGEFTTMLTATYASHFTLLWTLDRSPE